MFWAALGVMDNAADIWSNLGTLGTWKITFLNVFVLFLDMEIV